MIRPDAFDPVQEETARDQLGSACSSSESKPQRNRRQEEVERGRIPHGQKRVNNPEQQGQQANIKQNTTNQGHQQDR